MAPKALLERLQKMRFSPRFTDIAESLKYQKEPETKSYESNLSQDSSPFMFFQEKPKFKY